MSHKPDDNALVVSSRISVFASFTSDRIIS
jgi:hypothetical protein